MASIITAIILVLAVFFIVPWLFFLPKCVLSAIITTVVYSSELFGVLEADRSPH